jgi:hypothetical protein
MWCPGLIPTLKVSLGLLADVVSGINTDLKCLGPTQIVVVPVGVTFRFGICNPTR